VATLEPTADTTFLSIRDVTFLSHAYHTLLITIRHHGMDHQLEGCPRLIRGGSRVAVPSDILATLRLRGFRSTGCIANALVFPLILVAAKLHHGPRLAAQ
jgi:hypothetical protein